MDWRTSSAQRNILTNAERQEGLVSTRQLLEAGMSAQAIGRSPWLHSVARGVYAVGHTCVSRRGLLWVAHLATGAAIADESAAWDHKLLPTLTSPIHVVTTGGGRSRAGIQVHRRQAPAVMHRDGLPVTTPAETINHLPPQVQMRALREARYLRILEPQHLRGRARKGWERIKVVPAHRTRSELEHWLLEILDAHDLPHPLVNERLDGAERDFYWPRYALVVETDGGQHRWLDDARRDRELLARTGVRTMRFSGYEPVAEVAQTLRAVCVS